MSWSVKDLKEQAAKVVKINEEKGLRISAEGKTLLAMIAMLPDGTEPIT
jgi:hypothetical protein